MMRPRHALTAENGLFYGSLALLAVSVPVAVYSASLLGHDSVASGPAVHTTTSVTLHRTVGSERTTVLPGQAVVLTEQAGQTVVTATMPASTVTATRTRTATTTISAPRATRTVTRTVTRPVLPPLPPISLGGLPRG